MHQTPAPDPTTVVMRLLEAVNRHDLEAFSECLHPDYRSETPSHPNQAFRGRETVRRHWSGIFANIPDIRVELLGCVRDGDMVWAETHFFGTSKEGNRVNLRGVILHGVEASQIRWARLYLEAVEAEP